MKEWGGRFRFTGQRGEECNIVPSPQGRIWEVMYRSRCFSGRHRGEYMFTSPAYLRRAGSSGAAHLVHGGHS